MARNKQKGVSLAKGPVGIVGIVLLAYGISALIFGGHQTRLDVPSGTVSGGTWLGLEVNLWSSLLFTGAGALLLFGAPTHWGAKSLSLIVGLVLGAASVIALVDGDDVFGIFAANGWTKLAWGAAAAVLIVVSLFPRVGGKRADDRADDDRSAGRERSRRSPRQRPSRSRPGAVPGRLDPSVSDGSTLQPKGATMSPKDRQHPGDEIQGAPHLSGAEEEDPDGVVGETPNTETLSGDEDDEQHERVEQAVE